jgi:hypothetical protein
MVEGPSAGNGTWERRIGVPAYNMLSMLIYMINLDVLAHSGRKVHQVKAEARAPAELTPLGHRSCPTPHLFLNNNLPP